MGCFKKMAGVLALMSVTSGSLADEGVVTGLVGELLVEDANYGGCMARLSTDIRNTLPACGSRWVTFDCLVGFPETTKSIAQSKLSTAQLAMVTGKRIRAYVTDSRRANGYCLATRIDLLGD